MSGENIVVWALSDRTLESSGAAIASNAVGLADDSIYDIVEHGLSYPDAEFALSCTFATAPTECTVICLYARPLDIDGTNDTDVPEATRPTLYIGAFMVNNTTTAQYLVLQGGFARDLPRVAEYYLHNNNTGQQIAAGWTLKVLARTNKAAD